MRDYSYLSKNSSKKPNLDYVPPPMPYIKPPCKHNINIRLAHDDVYDVSVDGAWVFSRTSYENVLDELRKIFTIFEGDKYESKSKT